VLCKLILPIGDYKKEDVRKIAEDMNLPAAKRTESQEICFIEGRNYLKFIEKLSPFAGKYGPIMDMNGKVIGNHKGIYGYTIGQRKGMGISSPEPLYVIKIDVQKNIIYAGPREAAKKKEFFVAGLNWINPAISRFLKEGLTELRCNVKVRSTMKAEPATITFDTRCMMQDTINTRGSCIMHHTSKEVVRVVFDEPQWAPAPGQSAVFYEGDIVIGGGVII
jgi:tRNA-specific 2-thiouridylase